MASALVATASNLLAMVCFKSGRSPGPVDWSILLLPGSRESERLGGLPMRKNTKLEGSSGCCMVFHNHQVPENLDLWSISELPDLNSAI